MVSTDCKENLVDIRENEITIEFIRGSGPGGQHRNVTFSGVRIRHIPTGIVVLATENRSQHRNREIAMERLKQALARRMKRAKKRVPTAVPHASKSKRLTEKKIVAKKKMQRAVPPSE
jgi:protein subunit release factor B